MRFALNVYGTAMAEGTEREENGRLYMAPSISLQLVHGFRTFSLS